MDRLTSIRIFISAVNGGSFAAASRQFGLSAAMAGKYVSAIEADLNARLLERTTRRLTLTAAGEIYYERCKRILEAYDEANREVTGNHGSAHGVLRIVAPVTFGSMHLGGVIATYLEAHPQVNVEMSMSDRYVDLLDAGVDVAVRIGPVPDPGLVAQRLAPCRMVICASPDYLATHGTPETPDDLRQVPRLTFSEAVTTGDWTLSDAKDRVHVIDGPCRMATNDTQVLLAAVLAGAGIAYGPTFVFGEQIAEGKLVDVLPEYHTSDLVIQAVYPRARHLPLKLRRFLDYLAGAFGEEPPWDRIATKTSHGAAVPGKVEDSRTKS